MTRSSIAKPVSDCVDDALLAPWIVTGRVGAQDERLFSAALAADPALADDLACAEAERDAVVAMNEALGRPSARPMLALFAAIDAEEKAVPGNVTRLTFDRAPGTRMRQGMIAVHFRQEKISGWR